MIYASRLLCGITTAAVYLVVPLFIAEIVHPDWSGFMSSSFTVAVNFGILLEFILSTIINFRTLAIYLIFASAFALVGIAKCYDSPVFLISRGKIAAARESLNHYGLVINNEVNASVTETRDRVRIKAIILCAFPVLSGSFILMTFTHLLFENLNFTMNENWMPTVFTLIQLIGSCLATVVVDLIGKKRLLIYSTLGTMSGFALLAMYVFCTTRLGIFLFAFKLLAMISVFSIVFMCSVGMIPIPYYYAAELYSDAKARSIAMTMGSFVMWLGAFVQLANYLPLVGFIGNDGVFLIIAICNLFCLIFTIFLPPTNGINHL